MNTIAFNTYQSTLYRIDQANTHYVFTTASILSIADDTPALVDSPLQAEPTTGNTIDINGMILSAGHDFAVQLLSADTTVRVGTHGVVHGLFLGIDSGSVTNHGIVAGADYGIVSSGARIENHGRVSGGLGGLASSGGVIVNGADGDVHGDSGVVIDSGKMAPTTSHLTNHGEIDGITHGVYAALGRMILHNDGVIRGGIALADGNDLIDTLNGVVFGDIAGGAGNDTYIVSSASRHLVEAADGGRETVKSSVDASLGANFENLVLIGKRAIDGRGNGEDNTLTGNSADNRLLGGGGADLITGGGGTDRLSGGAGDDLFVFKRHSGHDTITDFDDGSDRLTLSRVRSDADFVDLKHNHLSISGHDLVIRYGDDVLTLHDMAAAHLGRADFVYDLGTL
jgi:Ca2+-binding RTX toxin-like protein